MSYVAAPLSQETFTQNSSQTQRHIRVKSDPAWGHCKVAEENEKTILLCLYCNKIFRGGGINRFKNHLAGEKGQCEQCKNVPADVRFQMKQNLDERKNKRRKVREEYVDSNEFGEDQMRIVVDEVQEPIRVCNLNPPQKGKNINRIGQYFMPKTTPRAQPTLKSGLQSKEVIEKCDLAIAKWMIDASVPFNAINSAYYQPMIDAISSMGPSYKGPNFHRVRGCLLNKWVDDVRKLVDGYRIVWKQTGCTLMADGWNDGCRRTFINFLVYCPKGTVFLRSVDVSHASKSAEMLHKLFREMVLFVGPENVVHIVTSNAENYVAAGRLLEAEFPKLYWSPCATQCINLMLDDIMKLEEVSEIVSLASKITKYIYNHCYSLYLMRKYTGGKDILGPAPTQSATNFIALQSILAHKDALRAMVTSRDWTSSAYAKESKAKKIVEQILDSRFWKKCADIVKLTEPLVHVLQIVDSKDKPAMGFLYQAMYKAKEEMIRRFQKNKKVEPYLNILDRHWDSLCKSIHAAGYWLNPACHFNEEFAKHKSTTSGLLDVIERYAHGDPDLQFNLASEMRIFKNAELDFGRLVATRERNTVMPDEWWESYGCGTPNLQKLAILVLSQTCSASSCERNWSIFEHIHSNKRNRLEHQKLNDLVYVRYNLKLQQRNPLRLQNYDPINFETLDDHSNWVVKESPPFLTNEEIDVLRNDLTNMSIQPISDDIVKLNLDDDDDDDAQDNTGENDDDEAQENTMENVNLNENNIDETSHFLDEEKPPADPTLAP
ncbi:hypothetical protein AAZX31_08G274000 [Glycine max]|nr:hypothetical protein GLYMA_08G283900v4 [Glycine max]KAH1053539.1 hypothetical protein GYH30_022684 [Glycine max]|eukprot:XP_006585941.1 uncharacterized protein LOC100794155 isoform X2 [Glycine max]